LRDAEGITNLMVAEIEKRQPIVAALNLAPQ
jgi:hypothetical protein